MCLLSFAYKVHPRYPLILIVNRDEFYRRAARKAQFWTEEGEPDILAGKDLVAGGTWMGVHKNGKWGVLTNYRSFENIKEDPPSRGDLVLNFLKQEKSPEQYLTHLGQYAHAYNGFNLLLGNQREIFHYSNVSDAVSSLSPGVHGLSNALMNTPWPKVERAKANLQEAVDRDDTSFSRLFKILADSTQAKEGQLPRTGLPLEMEKAVSSIFITAKDYGTRCSTLLFIDNKGKMKFVERTFSPDSTTPSAEVAFSI